MRIKVTGYFSIEPDEYDPGPLGPLTSEADEDVRMNMTIDALEDVIFERVAD